MNAELPNFKKFISEEQIEEAKQKRQEEWERVRRPDQPKEAPEEEYDPRSLFERLEANRIKKQEEYDEAHRLKNMLRGLEHEEIEFLDNVARQREHEEQIKEVEEKLILAEYRASQVYDRTQESPEVKNKKPMSKPTKQKTPQSQKLLLAGVIRRKSSSENDDVSTQKKPKPDETISTNMPKPRTEAEEAAKEPEKSADKPRNPLLPGLAEYATDSSDSSDADS